MGTDDYPRTVLELEGRFGTEAACRAYLMTVRWPEGFICPHCGAWGRVWMGSRNRLICSACRSGTSVTAGPIFQDAHQPLRVWFRAMGQVTSQKTGANAMGVQRALGLGRYQTAWTMLHTLRRAMVRPGRDRLQGHVEVDEIYVGGHEVGYEGRTARTKSLVAVAVEHAGGRIGRVRMGRIANARKTTLHRFIKETISPGSVVHTDGWTGYAGWAAKGYPHRITALQGRAKDAAIGSMPAVHRVSSLLKRWLLGTHQGAVQPQHLDYYLDEFTFRFNRRSSRLRGLLFYRLLQHAVQIDPVPYRTLVGGNGTPKI